MSNVQGMAVSNYKADEKEAKQARYANDNAHAGGDSEDDDLDPDARGGLDPDTRRAMDHIARRGPMIVGDRDRLLRVWDREAHRLAPESLDIFDRLPAHAKHYPPWECPVVHFSKK